MVFRGHGLGYRSQSAVRVGVWCLTFLGAGHLQVEVGDGVQGVFGQRGQLHEFAGECPQLIDFVVY